MRILINYQNWLSKEKNWGQPGKVQIDLTSVPTPARPCMVYLYMRILSLIFMVSYPWKKSLSRHCVKRCFMRVTSIFELLRALCPIRWRVLKWYVCFQLTESEKYTRSTILQKVHWWSMNFSIVQKFGDSTLIFGLVESKSRSTFYGGTNYLHLWKVNTRGILAP